jgi:U6 snRNA-associated Sm-like protein LSm4
MLPLYLLNAVKGETVVVELKSGGIINGTLENCDNYMNVTLTDACASLKEDEPFYKINHIYLRGQTIKLFKMGNEFIEKFKEQQQREKDSRNRYNNNNNNYNNRQYAHNNRQNKNYNNNTGNRRNNRNYNNNNSGNKWGNRDAFEARI